MHGPKKIETNIKYPQFIKDYINSAEKILGTVFISRGILLSLLLTDKLSWQYTQDTCDTAVFSKLQALVEETVSGAWKYTNKKIDILLLDLYMQRAEDVYREVVRIGPVKKIPFADKLPEIGNANGDFFDFVHGSAIISRVRFHLIHTNANQMATTSECKVPLLMP